MRTKLVIGNWKMHKVLNEAERDFAALSEGAAAFGESLHLGIAAPYLHLPTLASRNFGKVRVYAQNAHWASQGAFTGEISAEMLKSIHVRGSLVGHSERRQFFGETNSTVGKRVAALLKANMEAVLCIGETLEERESGNLKTVLRSQLEVAFQEGGLKNAQDLLGSDPAWPLLSLAYEPVWAIGTGKAASAEEAQEAHAYIRGLLTEFFGQDTAQQLRILYGGSVKPGNVAGFLGGQDVDGALVGGASLKPDEFLELCKAIKK